MALTKPSSGERPFVKDSSYPFGLGSSRNFRLRNVRNIVTVQITAEAQRREAEVENMRSWEAEKISTSFSLRPLRLRGELLPKIVFCISAEDKTPRYKSDSFGLCWFNLADFVVSAQSND